MFSGGLFWFAMGVLFVLVAWAFKTFVDDRGWRLSWWKSLLLLLWYAILSLSFFAWGTLVGEGEAGAGFKLFLIGLFVSIVFGAGLIRLLIHRPKTPVQPSAR